MLIFDIETDGLLDECTKVHCMVIYDTTTDTYTEYRPHEIMQGVKRLEYGDPIVGHNVIAFDIPVLQKLYNFKLQPQRVIDTLVLSRLVYSNLKDIDMGLIRKGTLPAQLMGSHSLKAYGYRLGVLKGDYAEDNDEAWVCFNEDMLAYNKQDVTVTHALYQKLVSKGFSPWVSRLEHDCQWLMQKQERNGYPFDVTKAKSLEQTLRQKSEEIATKLASIAPPIEGDLFIPKRDNKTLGYKKGVPVQRYKEFNPNSRQQLEYILSKHYGYKFTDKRMYNLDGKLKLDEETLDLIANDTSTTDEIRHIAQLYSEYLMLAKRLGQLADGNNAWLKLVQADGRIHGKCNPNGAVSGRATHSLPNMSQVPSINSPYGAECRELFGVPDGWYQVGIDCSGLELRCLAHYLFPIDHGSYANEVLNGDIHTLNQKSAGLATRNDAKRFIYSFLYGAGNAKIGEIVGGNEDDGARLKAKFLKNTPQIKKLQTQLKDKLAPFNKEQRKRVWKTRYMEAIDGRQLYVRSLHSALNLLLQSCGAIICKDWIVRLNKNLKANAYRHGWDGDYAYMVWSHDEVQIACKTKETAEDIIRIAEKTIRETQEVLGINIQLDVEGKIGKNWKECH